VVACQVAGWGARPGVVRGGRLVACRFGWWWACRWRRAVRLICAGWLPQGGMFGRSGPRV